MHLLLCLRPIAMGPVSLLPGDVLAGIHFPSDLAAAQFGGRLGWSAFRVVTIEDALKLVTERTTAAAKTVASSNAHLQGLINDLGDTAPAVGSARDNLAQAQAAADDVTAMRGRLMASIDRMKPSANAAQNITLRNRISELEALVVSLKEAQVPSDLGTVTVELTLEPGRLAYEAYLAVSDGKSLVSGAVLPTYDELPEAIRKAWEAAGGAVWGHRMGITSDENGEPIVLDEDTGHQASDAAPTEPEPAAPTEPAPAATAATEDAKPVPAAAPVDQVPAAATNEAKPASGTPLTEAVAGKYLGTLTAAGITTIEQLAAAKPDALIPLDGIGKARAAQLITAATTALAPQA